MNQSENTQPTPSSPDSPEISVSVNGQSVSVADGATLAELLNLLAFRSEAIAVERNYSIVPQNQFAECVLEENDVLFLKEMILYF